MENRLATIGETRSALYESMKRDARKKDRKKKWEPYVRKTVPSMFRFFLFEWWWWIGCWIPANWIEQTALLGSVGEEFNTLPVENDEFRAISERKALEALKPKRETVFIDKVPGKLLQPRNALPGEKGAFVVSPCIPGLFILLR